MYTRVATWLENLVLWVGGRAVFFYETSPGKEKCVTIESKEAITT